MLQSLPHQIVQSPARLGLSNPNSPAIQSPSASKLPSQIPQSQNAHQQPNLLTTKITSQSLLTLLPPLPRAQTLLLQMASLASKLFEVSPNRSQWLSSFRGSLPSFLASQAQSTSLPSLDSSPSTTKEVLAAFTSLQTQLFEAVAELQEILDLQDAKQKLNREVRSKDAAILAFANKLKEAERVLDMLVDDYADYRRPKRTKLDDDDGEDPSSATMVASRLNLSDVLSYAHRISYTTFAPPEFGAGQAPLRGALPPAPQDEQMRASQLYNFADLDVGVPKTAEDKAKTIDPLMEVLPPPPPSANAFAHLGAIPGLPNVVPPPGWKPGMPVVLPTDFPGMPAMLQSDLPLPPPGWKPGDPVPLPPISSVPPNEQQPIPPHPAQVMPRGHEQPIQVAHVQLDILEDDDSSDYSSDEGSSDDDT